MSAAVESLPWQSLALQTQPIPWSDLRRLADAAVESADVREELIRRGEVELNRQADADCYDASDLTDLGVAAVFGLAADRLREEDKPPIAEFLLRMLKRGSETGLDYLEEAGERAVGRLGPVIVDPLLRLIERERCGLHCWFAAWALLCVADSAPADARQRVARLARQMIRECPDRFETVSQALGPAWALEAIGDRDALPLLEATYEQSLDHELLQIITRLKHGQGNHLPRAWHVPVEEWLPDIIVDLREICEEERRARESSSPNTPAEPEDDADEETNYTADWKHWLSGERRSLDQQSPEVHVTIVREEPRHNRNEPCPCGSGKKYKKCCGR